MLPAHSGGAFSCACTMGGMHRTDWITIAVIVLGGVAFLGLIIVTGAWREGWEWLRANVFF
jgi:hypothetical protein